MKTKNFKHIRALIMNFGKVSHFVVTFNYEKAESVEIANTRDFIKKCVALTNLNIFSG